MRKLTLLLGIVALLAVPAMAAHWIARRTQWDFQLTYLAALTLASGILSLLIAAQRARLRRQLLMMSKQEVQALSAASEDIQFAFPTLGSRASTSTVLVGIITVNLPTLPMLVGPLIVLQTWFSAVPPLPQFAALGIGLMSAWLWWSVGVTKWRRWAEQGGMSAAEVQYRGERAAILWPRGHFFESTEWANIEARFRNDA